MKNDDTLQQYLEATGWDLAEAKRQACREHHFMDQTLDMKFTRLEQMMEERNV